MAPSMGPSPFPSSPDTIYNPILQRYSASLGRPPPKKKNQFYSGSSIYTTAQLGSHPDHPAGLISSRNRVFPVIPRPSLAQVHSRLLLGCCIGPGRTVNHTQPLSLHHLPCCPVLNHSPLFLRSLCFLTLPGTSSGTGLQTALGTTGSSVIWCLDSTWKWRAWWATKQYSQESK